MASTPLSSGDFNQDASKAKKAARRGRVFITDRGGPAHVLLTIEEYRRITKKRGGILEALAMPEAAAVKFDPPRLAGRLYREADLS